LLAISVSSAQTAQSTANTAATNALLLDAAYCADETDMASKNLRVGAFVLMEVSNDSADTPESVG